MIISTALVDAEFKVRCPKSRTPVSLAVLHIVCRMGAQMFGFFAKHSALCKSWKKVSRSGKITASGEGRLDFIVRDRP